LKSPRLRETFQGVYFIEEDQPILVTRNLVPGRMVYGERLIRMGEEEYRSWNPTRSKLAAAIMKGLGEMPILSGSKVLYLGVASGTTCSHISDIVGREGHIWGVDFSARSLRDLIDNVARHRRNISPILGDAREPNRYSAQVPKVDVIYSDVAQPDQAEIVLKNAFLFLSRGGCAMLAIKSRSVDVTKEPGVVYSEQVEVLKRGGFTIGELVELDPYEKDHALALARR
jgi:fibrillarin-like pre-rRNA processing protein